MVSNISYVKIEDDIERNVFMIRCYDYILGEKLRKIIDSFNILSFYGGIDIDMIDIKECEKILCDTNKKEEVLNWVDDYGYDFNPFSTDRIQDRENHELQLINILLEYTFYYLTDDCFIG